MPRSSSALLSSSRLLTLILCTLIFSAIFSTSAFAQASRKQMAPAEGNDQDQQRKRAEWNMRGREAPKGESAAALRLRAHQQKMAMRAQREAAARAAGVGSASSPLVTTWVNLGPAPLASDATGNGFQDYNWVSGRATSVLVDPADTTGNTVYLGGAYGGLWKSTNAGSKSATPNLVTWQALIDDQPSLAVGAIALQPGNSNLILVGTGETNSSGDSYYGMGILRSTDGGATWTQITSAASGQSFVGVGFSKMAFSTSNTNLVVASTAGDIGIDFGLEQDANSTARGVYYSVDAGATWNRVMLSDSAVPASATGVVYNASQGSTGTFYAAIRRHGIYSSTDGQHFTRLATQPTAGLASANCPAGSNSANCQIYRAEFAVTPARNEMYVWVVDAQSSEIDDGIWRTTNGGTAWTQIPDNGITNCGLGGDSGGDQGCGVQQGVYDLELAAVPNSTGTDVYAGTINIYKCHLASGASSCSTIDTNVPNDWINLTHVYGCSNTQLGALAHVHPDQHGLGFMVVGSKAPGYFAHDGGISRTLDGFTGLDSGSCTGTNQFDSLSQTLGSMTEFVSFSVHPTSADILLGGTQDNGSPKTATATSSPTWQNALSGDGGFNVINPNPGPPPFGDGVAGDEWFVSQPFTLIGVCESGTACNDNNTFVEASSSNLGGDTGAFYTPYILDPQSTGEMLIGTCRMWRGDTPTSTFSTLSNNFDTGTAAACTGGEVNQVAGLAAGGPKDANGFSNVVYGTTWGYGPLVNIGGGEVWVTTNAATTLMSNVTGSINPKTYAISSVAIDTSVANGQTAYVGIMGFHTSHVWKTTNAGTSWTDWSGNLPDAPVSALLVDSAAGVVYAGTDVGVFSSSTTVTPVVWTEVGPVAGPGTGFLPSAPVTAIQIFSNGVVKELRVSTYGRGIWEFNLPLAADFTNVISDSPQTMFPNQNATFHGTLTSQGGYNSPVNLSCTGTKPTTCTLNPTQVTPTAGGATYTVTAGGAVGDYSFNAHGVGTDSSNTTHDAAVTLHVVDFALTPVSPSPIIVPQGFTGTATFQVTASGSFAQGVTLSCPSGLPLQATCGFSPSSTVNPTAGNPVTVTLTVSTTGSTPQGTTTVTLQGTTSGPTATRSENFTLTVGPPPDFTLATSGSTTHTVLAGQMTKTYSFIVTATGGATTFLGPVTFSCPAGLPALTNCLLPTINAGASSPQTVTVAIATTGPNPGTGPTIKRGANKRSPWLPLALPIAGLVMVGFVGRKVSKYSAVAGLCISLALIALMMACGGGSGPPVVTITPSSAQVPLGGTQQFSANVSVTWSVTGAGQISSTSGLYTAPSAGTTPTSATVTATPTSGTAATAAVTIPAVGVSVTPTPVNIYANEAGNAWPANLTQQQFTATVTNSSNAAVTWSVSSGGGSIDANGLYTSPATVPNPAAVTVTATSVADPSHSGPGTVNVLTPTALGTSNVTVTATEGSISHSQAVTLIVQ